MGTRSLALYQHLLDDLSDWLPGCTYPNPLQVIEQRGGLWPDIRPDQVAAVQLLRSIFKKFQEDVATDAESKALEKFLSSNESCGRFSWPEASSLTTLETVALGEIKSLFWDFFFPTNQQTTIMDLREIFDNMAVGPGASRLATGDSLYHKLASSPLSATSRSLARIYRYGILKYSLWRETEKIRSARYGDVSIVAGNKLSYVPKSTEVCRTICTEPLLNMIFQKGIGTLFESRLKARWGINLSVQPDKNRELARRGSIDGSFGTIDLSSASDSISLEMLRSILPGEVFTWLDLTRSPITELPDGSRVSLKMVSSMGNAFTFPLQTILFTAIVLGCYKARGIKPQYPRGLNVGNFGVFGDDIIVTRESYNLVIKMLEVFGFSVNKSKSFNDGPFRESCGSDFWSGRDVRGVYCTSLSSTQDVYSLINRLNVWSANQGIPLPNSIQYLSGLVKFLPVPVYESDTAGVKVPYELIRQEVGRDKHTGSVLYKRWVSKPKTLDLRNVGQAAMIDRRVIHNPSGILLAAVGGWLRDGRVSVRLRRAVFTKRAAISPCWDWYSPYHSRLTSDGWHRWVTAYAAYNLGRG